VSGASQYIVKRARPAATRVSDPAVFDVPGGRTGACKRGAQVPGMTQIVRRSPKTSVDEHDHWMGAFAWRHA
jgi:hypothetical protein